MNHKLFSERGQALVLIVFAMMGLIGITGLAIDGGIAFSDRRHAQNAADTAAFAGALGIAKPQYDDLDNLIPWTTLARDRAESNGYAGDLVRSTVEVYTCNQIELGADCEEPYSGDEDYVQVIITSNVNTFFAKVIGIPQVHNRVQAIAYARADNSGPNYPGDSIIALSQECQVPDNFTVGGTADVTVTGGDLYINTNDPACGFTCNSSDVTIDGNIVTAGSTIDTSAHCGDNIDGTTSTTGTQWEFPVTLESIGMDVPEECDGPIGTYSNYAAGSYPGFPTTDVTVLTPGSYSDFPPKKEQPLGNLYDTIFMKPGVYCVNSVLKLTERNLVLIGHDVTLFIRAGFDFSLNGGTFILDAPDTGDYAGYLIVVEPDYGDPSLYPDLTVDPLACNINGNSVNSFTGTIFAPYCNVTIDGGSEPTGYNSQVIAYTVKLTGTSTIDFYYDASQNGERIDPPKTGLAH